MMEAVLTKSGSGSLFGSVDLAKAIPQGTADHVGRDMRIRQYVLATIQATYERFWVCCHSQKKFYQRSFGGDCFWQQKENNKIG